MKKQTNMKYKIILASNSPRRRELLAGLDIPFQVKVLPGVSESYPEDLPVDQIPEYIAQEKAAAYKGMIGENELVLTADTVVILDNEVLGKPKGLREAGEMLHRLSGKTHRVVTGVCLTTQTEQRHFSVTTEVTFRELTDMEIAYYVDRYKPTDKAGAYGVQEWIGYIGVTGLKSSYYNVMGLPVQRIYQELKNMH